MNESRNTVLRGQTRGEAMMLTKGCPAAADQRHHIANSRCQLCGQWYGPAPATPPPPQAKNHRQHPGFDGPYCPRSADRMHAVVYYKGHQRCRWCGKSYVTTMRDAGHNDRPVKIVPASRMSNTARGWLMALGVACVLCGVFVGISEIDIPRVAPGHDWNAPFGFAETDQCGTAWVVEDPVLYVPWADIGGHTRDMTAAEAETWVAATNEACDTARAKSVANIYEWIGGGMFLIFFSRLHSPLPARRRRS